MGRTRLAKALVSSLQRNKEASQSRKNELVDYLKRLNQAHANKQISGAKYVETLTKKTNGRNIKEWVDYYENYSKNCEKAIERQKAKVIRNRVLALFFGVLFLGGFIFAALSLDYSSIGLTGFFVGEGFQEQEYSQIIGLITNESTNYELNLENPGQLSSVKINGEIKGEGEIKVYLNDLLILDSSKIKSKSSSPKYNSPLTGMIIEETETITTDSQTTTSEDSYSETETPSKEDSSPSQEESLTETTNSQTISSEVSYSEEKIESEVPLQEESSPSQEEPQASESLDKTLDDTPQTENESISYSETETPSKEESSPSQEESLTETNQSYPQRNQTEDIETNEREVQTNVTYEQESNETQSNISYSETETPLKEESSPSQGESLTENIFNEFCEDTCNLEKLNLTNSSYTLRVEIEGNVTLRLGSIDYSIILEEVPLISENITVNTVQYDAVLGKPVKWKKQIELPEKGNVKVELPKGSEKIVVSKIIDRESYSEKEASQKEESSPSQGKLLTENRKVKEKSNSIEVLIEDNSDLYEIEYETPAPYSSEEETEKGKKVIIAGSEEVHYENVLAFTNLSESLDIRSPSELKIYWIEEEVYLPAERVEDKDNNGFYDYVEWIVPHLSNQTFLITIQSGTEGKDAHIDSSTPNRNFGASTSMIISNTERMLLEFDLSDVTETANIVNANLTLYLSSAGTGTNPISVYRINNSWIEGTGDSQNTYDGVTWTNRSGTESWDIPGGDFDSRVWAIRNLTTAGTYYTLDITQLVQNWVNGTYENYGIILYGENGHGQWHFPSSDNINATIRPQLNITYNESQVPVINSVSIPSTIREGENLSLTANITDNLEVEGAIIEIDNLNYSLGQNPQTISNVAIIRPAAKGTIETNRVVNYLNSYDNNNDTSSGINAVNPLLTIKTSGVSVAGIINSVKVKVIHSKLSYDTIGYLHWASSNGGEEQGLTHEFNSTSETPEITEFDVTSERDWSFADFNLLTEIHLNNSDSTLKIYEVWFEVNYTTPASNDLWNGTIDTSRLSAGNYTYTIFANDSSDNLANYQNNFTILPQLVLVNVSMNDAQGNFQEAEVIIYNTESQEVEMNSTMTESELISVEEGEKNILINPVGTPVFQIEYENTLIENYTEGIIDIDQPSEVENFTKVYALNPHLNTNATVTAFATGNELYKCKDWNFTNQSCYGEWIKVMDITPGEEYNFTLSPEDPAFAEVIVIIFAHHLNSTRDFISDIYQEVVLLDDIWSEEIPDGDYVRVTFESNLTSDRDITIYPRIVSGTPRIEIYEVNESTLIAEFNPIINNSYNKRFLTSLIGEQDTFDLRIIGGSVEFDYIVDPPDYLSCVSGTCIAVFNITTGANTWQVPTEVTEIMIEAWGGGGAGGGSISNGYGGGGGAGGQYAKRNLTVTPSTTFNIFIASSITGGTGDGSQGYNTSFFNSTGNYVVAMGGEGGKGGINKAAGAGGLGSISGGVGTTIYGGGNGYTGSSSGGGGGGGSGTTGWGGNSTSATGGTGTSIGGGDGGAGNTDASGDAGLNYGGAGGGGERAGGTNGVGGTGAQGMLKITYAEPVDLTSPQYNSVSVNNTLAGQITNFAINVTDNIALHPNGQYIFSTNNTGVWINDSFWQKDLTINASLPDIGTNSKPSVFYKDSSWYLISGIQSGEFFGFAYNGTNWLPNSTINASLPDIGSNTNPYVFYKDSSWYLISGEAGGNFYGFAWDGTQWLPNSTINASLPGIGISSVPSVFYKDSSWYLISGERDGNFYGFAWDGTQWLPNSTINTSLPNLGETSFISPYVFYKDSSWYLISGENTGNFYGFAWDGTQWLPNSIINASLSKTISKSSPSVFYKDSSWYLISGDTNGIFFGYKYSDATNFTSTPSWANVTKTLNSTSGMVVGYRWYFKDSYSTPNYNSTPVYTLTTTPYYGILNVSIILPENYSGYFTGNTNLTINASVTCVGGAYCGTVSATARYNLSSASPDTNINISEGGSPFYNLGSGGEDIYVYNFSGITNPSSTHKATNGSCSSFVSFQPNNQYEFYNEGYSNLVFIDGFVTKTSLPSGFGSNKPYEKFDFKILESKDSINEINLSIYGRSYSSSDYQFTVFVYNYSGGIMGDPWKQVSSINLEGFQYHNLTFNKTTSPNIDEIIGSDGIIQILVKGYSDIVSTSIEVDFIEIKVNGSRGASNPQTSSVILNEGESFYPNWTINVTSTTPNQEYLLDVLFNSSYGNSNVLDNNTEDRRIILNPGAGSSECGSLDIENKSCTLTGNISSLENGFNITAQNITLDCGGNYIIGSNVPNSKGILINSSNVTITNCKFSNFPIDIYTLNGNNITLYNITGGSEYGLIVNGTTNSNFTNISFNNVTIAGILVTNNSHNNTFTDININSSAHGIYVEGGQSNTFDCANGLINYSQGGGGWYFGITSNQFNTTIKNCNIFNSNRTTTYSYSMGIQLTGSSNSSLYNNYVDSGSSAGIYVTNSHFNLLVNNFGSSVNNQGLRLESSYNNLLINNTGSSSSNGGIGITGSTSHSNTLINCTARGGNTGGMYFTTSSHDNEIINLNASGSRAVRITGSSNNTIRDCLSISGTSADVYISNDAGGINSSFVNCSYDLSKEIFEDAVNELTRKWYYMAYVNDSSGNPVENANITAYNSTGDLQFTALTNSTGHISRQEVIEYFNDAGTRSYYNNYTINANKSGYINDSNEFNFTITQNKVDDWFTLTEEAAGPADCNTIGNSGILDTDNGVYTLTENISSQGTCLTVAAANVTIDCNGYWITFSTDGATGTRGIYSNQFNTTIKDCNIIDGNWTTPDSWRAGVFFTIGADYGLIQNVSTNVSNCHGIDINGGSGIRVYNSTGRTKDYHGIIIWTDASNITLLNSTGISNTSVGIGIYGNNNSIYNSTGQSTYNSYGIYLPSVSNNLISGCNASSDSNHGIFAQNSTNNTLINNNITSNSGGGIVIYSYSTNNTLINNNVSTNSGSAIYILALSNNNTLLRNNATTNSASGQAIYIYNSSYMNLTENKATSTSSSGIYIEESSDNNTLTSNNGTSYAADNFGIVLGTSSNNILTNNTGMNVNNGIGIYIAVSSNNNTLINNTAISNTGQGVYIYSNYNNTLINQKAYGGLGVFIINANSTTFRDCVEISGTTFDVNLFSTPLSKNNTFINCSYDTETVGGTDNELIRKWYYQAYVNDTSGSSVSDANVTSYNATGVLQSTAQTNSSGWISRQEVTEYVNTGGTRSFYNNYSIFANKSGYINDSNEFNFTITQNKVNDWFTLEGGGPADCTTIGNSGILDTDNAFYTLTENISSQGTCLDVVADNVTIDCNGYWINYSINGQSGDHGIYTNQFNTTIRNCNIVDGNWTTSNTGRSGIYFSGVINGTIQNNSINISNTLGILLNYKSSNNILINNNVYSFSGTAISIYNSTNNLLENNTGISNSSYGISLQYYDEGNILINNTGISNTSNGIYVYYSHTNNLTNNNATSTSNHGMLLDHSDNNTLTNNNGTSLEDSNGIYIYPYSENNTLIGNIGTSLEGGVGISLWSSANNTLINNTGLSNSSRGILLAYSNNVTLTNNTGRSNFARGIDIQSSNESALIDNEGISLAGSYGIIVYTSKDNTLIDNIGTSNTSNGISIQYSSNINLINNTGINNYQSQGFLIYYSNNNTLINNTGRNLDYGNRGLYISNCLNNTVINQIGTGTRGIAISGSNHTLIRDCINVTGRTNDVYISDASTNVTFINCSYNYTPEYVGAGSELIRKWYYQAYVNDSSGAAVEDANVTAYNITAQIQFTEQTNGSGWIGRQEVIEYINTAGTRSYYNNYTINATNTTFTEDHIFNFTITQNKVDDVFTLDDSGTADCNTIGNSGKLDVEGQTYTLTENISSQGTCLTVSAENVTIDCNGYWINHSINGTDAMYGIYSNQFNTTIKNCNIIDGNWSIGTQSRRGIYLVSSHNSTLFRNFINESNSQGVYTSGSNYMNITNNTISSSSSQAIRLSSSHYNILVGNNIRAYSLYGTALTSGSSNNTFINHTSKSNTDSIRFESSANGNLFINTNSSGKYAFHFEDSSYNNITDCIYASGTLEDVYAEFETIGSAGNIFLNCSYDTENTTGEVNQIIRKWYYQAYVNDTSGSAVESANITAYNTTGDLQFTALTNSTGHISRQEVIEYVNASGTVSYYNNYTIFANKTGYVGDINVFNFTITQNKVDDWFTLDENTPPQIISVYNSTEMTDISSGPNEGPVVTYVLLNFTAYDEQGFDNLDDSSVQVNFSLAGESSRVNSSCALLGDYDTNYANYTCNVTMWWWDAPGTWSINASIEDVDGNSGFNDSTTFAVGSTTGFLANSTNVNWPDIPPGATNIEALSPMLLNNTGNEEINVEVNATNLTGESYSNYALGASNFSVHTSPGCGGTQMFWYQYTTVVGAVIPKGNYSLNDGTAQETIYFCLEESNANLISQAYSTTQQGSWTIRIFLVAVTFGRRRKKKGKTGTIEKDKLLKAINLVSEEMKEEYSPEKEQVINILVKEVKKKYRVNNKEISEFIISKKEIEVSIDVFSKNLGALEALVKYMKENLNMNYVEIARRLGRDERTIWTAYKKASDKHKEPLKIKESGFTIPIERLGNEKLTVLEAIIIYLKEKGKKYSEIGKLLNRDQRNIWTIYSKAINKR